MAVLEDLQNTKRVFIRCPSCGENFPVAKARLFDATRNILPSYALALVNAGRQQIAESRAELRKLQLQATQRALAAAKSVRIGKVVEKLLPALKGFDFVAGDCRALFEPIDYVVFEGLSTKGRVEAVQFVDVKSGSAGLNAVQRNVRDVVKQGKVTLVIAKDL